MVSGFQSAILPCFVIWTALSRLSLAAVLGRRGDTDVDLDLRLGPSGSAGSSAPSIATPSFQRIGPLSRLPSFESLHGVHFTPSLVTPARIPDTAPSAQGKTAVVPREGGALVVHHDRSRGSLSSYHDPWTDPEGLEDTSGLHASQRQRWGSPASNVDADDFLQRSDLILYDSQGKVIQKPLHWHVQVQQALEDRNADPMLEHKAAASASHGTVGDRIRALAMWSEYRAMHLFQPVPAVVHQGAFFPEAARALQYRIDQLIKVKAAVLKQIDRRIFTVEERILFMNRFHNWRALAHNVARDGYQAVAPYSLINAAEEDKSLLQKLELLLQRAAANLPVNLHR